MAQLADAFAQITAWAERNGQDAVAQAGREAVRPDRPERLLVLGWDADLAPAIRAWVSHEVPHVGATAATPGELAEAKWSAASADRVLAVLPCDTFLDAAQFEQVEQFVLARPSGTFRMVLGANDPDQSALMRCEAGLQHLIGSVMKSGQPCSPGPEHLFFWMPQPWGPQLAERLSSDERALLTWLRQPLTPGELHGLARFRALELLDAIEAHALSAGATTGAPATLERRRLSTLSEQMRRCRRRMLEMVDRGAASVQRELSTSLSTLERDLLQDVRIRLRQKVEEAHEGITREPVSAAVARFVRGKLASWTEETHTTLTHRTEELARDMEALVQGNDWPLLNDLFSRQGLPGQYPNDLLLELRCSEDVLRDAIGLPSNMSLPESLGDVLPRDFSRARTSWLGALCVGTLTAATTFWLLPFGTLGALLGGGLGAMGGAYAGRRQTNLQAIDHLSVRIEQAVVKTAQEAFEVVNRVTREVASRLRAPLERRFETIDAVLAQAASSRSAEGPPAAETPATQLARLREQILAATPAQ